MFVLALMSLVFGGLSLWPISPAPQGVPAGTSQQSALHLGLGPSCAFLSFESSRHSGCRKISPSLSSECSRSADRHETLRETSFSFRHIDDPKPDAAPLPQTFGLKIEVLPSQRDELADTYSSVERCSYHRP